MQSLMSDVDGHLHYYSLCQFGKSVNPLPDGTLSSSRVVCYTNAPVASRPCTCDPTVPHIQDWSNKSQSIRPGQKREELITHIAGYIFDQTKNFAYRPMPDIGSVIKNAPSNTQSHPNKPIEWRSGTGTVPDTGTSTTTGLCSNAKDLDTGTSTTGDLQQDLQTSTRKWDNAHGAFPTEARIRQKKAEQERKEAGKEPKKRQKFLEDHYDDCGDSLKGIAHLDDELPDEYFHCLPDSEDDDKLESYNATDGLEELFTDNVPSGGTKIPPTCVGRVRPVR